MTIAIIVAAGTASRMGGVNKILLPLAGTPVLGHTLLAFQQAASIDGIVITTRPELINQVTQLAHSLCITKLLAAVPGGATRQQSVNAGVQAAGACDYLAIHDGARPLITPGLINDILKDTQLHGAATAATPVKDTIKQAGAGGFITSTPPRHLLFSVQTPQAMRRDFYLKGYAAAVASGQDFTDDNQLLEAAGIPVYLSKGSYSNIKITTAEDISLAQLYLQGDTPCE